MNEGCRNYIGPYPCCSIITGDAKELAKAIPDESVDLIFTDPVYDRIEDYRWLAETAARVLKPASICLIFVGTQYKSDVLVVMTQLLTYRWDFANIVPGMLTRFVGNIGVKVISLLWLEKGHTSPTQPIFDSQMIPTNGDKYHSHWNKGVGIYTRYVETFGRNAEGLVYDPFTGGGTVPAVCKMLGRHYLAFEIDPDVAERARERVRNTQPPLFVMQPHQEGMFNGPTA